MYKIIMRGICILAMGVSIGKSSCDTPPPLGPAARYNCRNYLKGATLGAGAAVVGILAAKNRCDKDNLGGASLFPYSGAIIGGLVGALLPRGCSGSDSCPNSDQGGNVSDRLSCIVQGVMVGADIGTKCAEVGRMLSRADRYALGSGVGTTFTKMVAFSATVGWSALVVAEFAGKIP
ncbi:MAG: hypothetical protein LBL32_03410 [Holosporales bacterium]|jgi:hypothetical protein|nr:hypothetical protein [Holosporales bacterium]